MTDTLLNFFGAGALPPVFGAIIQVADTAPTPFTSAIIDCQDWLGIRFRSVVNTQSAIVFFDWYSADPNTDPTAVKMGQATWTLAGNGLGLPQSLIHKGPYLQVVAIGFAPGCMFTLLVQQTNNVTDATGSVDGVLSAGVTEPIGAGATVVTPINRPYAGEAGIHFTTTAAAWTLTLNATLFSGATFPIFSADNASVLGGKRLNSLLFLPPAILDITVTNGDGAPKTYDYALLPRTYNY